MRVRNLLAVGSTFALLVGLMVAVVTISGPPRPAVPRQQSGTAAGKSHRVPAAFFRRRVVDGRIVDVGSAQRPSGAAAQPSGSRSRGPSGSSRGASADPVTMALPPKPLHFPIRGKAADKVRVVAAPAPEVKTGFDPKTSRELPPRGPSEDVYSNADGTKSAFESSLPGTGMVKEQLVLDSSAAPASWVFPLDLTGLRARMGSGGLVEFVDASGTVQAYVPHGFMSDSNVDPHSGDGATSFGVTYSLISVGGRQAIKMTLDTAWLDDPARVFPVTADPTVIGANSDGTTYVQYPDNNDFSGDFEMHVGTYDGGSHKARSYLSFSNVASSLHHDTVLGAQLAVFNTWSYSCSPRPVYVYPVTSLWSVTGDKTWPGPSTGAAIGRASFATGWVPLGSTTSPCPSHWEPIKLDQAGTNLINGWTHDAGDNGLALGASTSDSYGWKKFASHASGTGNPVLDVTYTTDGASYALGSRRPITAVLPGQNGKFKIMVTNTGSTTWTPDTYWMSYDVYNSAKKLVASHPVFTALPKSVGYNQTVEVDANVDALPAGKYVIVFDMYSGNQLFPVSFSSEGIAPFAIGLDIPQPPPTVTGVYPPSGYIAPALRQPLSVVASTATGTITYSFTLTCKPLPDQACGVTTIKSGSIAKPYWTPPAASLQWNTPYQWSVTTTVNGAGTTTPGVSLEWEVPQAVLTGHLGISGSQAFDPLSGNYTTSATDASVATAGIPLQIGRTYSMDPRTSGAFGAGWSSIIDTALRPDGDGTGNTSNTNGDVLVTLPDGDQLRFGENGDGTYAPPMGSHDVLAHNSDGTWTLRDSSDEQFKFTSAGLISKIIDPNGRALLFTDNSSNQVTTVTDVLSGRTLTLTWGPGRGQRPARARVVGQHSGAGHGPVQLLLELRVLR